MEQEQADFSKDVISLPAKRKVFSIAAAILLVGLMAFCLYLICFSENALSLVWQRVLVGLIMLFIILANLFGALWMMFGKEKFNFKPETINYTKTLFGFNFGQKVFYFSRIKKCWINGEIANNAYLGKNDFMLLTSAVYPAFGNTFCSSFGLTGGKLFLNYSDKLYRIGASLSESEAEKLSKKIQRYLS